MEIGVTSQNKLKVNAVIGAYSAIQLFPNVVGYVADSGVGEQPVDEITLLGARNRIIDVRQKINGLDRIVSIESGIFREGNLWIDKAVVVIYDSKREKEFLAYSDGIVFPDKYVEMARTLGFDKHTVGSVMAKEGYIVDSKDPHKTISGISRQEYIQKTVSDLVREVELNK
jgi:non-canonical (house-cleaning) NTP pyrophosphatase